MIYFCTIHLSSIINRFSQFFFFYHVASTLITTFLFRFCFILMFVFIYYRVTVEIYNIYKFRCKAFESLSVFSPSKLHFDVDTGSNEHLVLEGLDYPAVQDVHQYLSCHLFPVVLVDLADLVHHQHLSLHSFLVDLEVLSALLVLFDLVGQHLVFHLYLVVLVDQVVLLVLVPLVHLVVLVVLLVHFFPVFQVVQNVPLVHNLLQIRWVLVALVVQEDTLCNHQEYQM